MYSKNDRDKDSMFRLLYYNYYVAYNTDYNFNLCEFVLSLFKIYQVVSLTIAKINTNNHMKTNFVKYIIY